GVALQPRAAPSLAAIACFGLDAYWAHEDFTLLHIVTGCHAFRLVERFAGDKPLARRYLWQAALAAWLTVVAARAGREEGGTGGPAGGPEPEPEAIAAQARLSGDDHTIKLCHTALCEHREYGDRRYLQVAARKLGLVA